MLLLSRRYIQRLIPNGAFNFSKKSEKPFFKKGEGTEKKIITPGSKNSWFKKQLSYNLSEKQLEQLIQNNEIQQKLLRATKNDQFNFLLNHYYQKHPDNCFNWIKSSIIPEKQNPKEKLILGFMLKLAEDKKYDKLEKCMELMIESKNVFSNSKDNEFSRITLITRIAQMSNSVKYSLIISFFRIVSLVNVSKNEQKTFKNIIIRLSEQELHSKNQEEYYLFFKTISSFSFFSSIYQKHGSLWFNIAKELFFRNEAEGYQIFEGIRIRQKNFENFKKNIWNMFRRQLNLKNKISLSTLSQYYKKSYETESAELCFFCVNIAFKISNKQILDHFAENYSKIKRLYLQIAKLVITDLNIKEEQNSEQPAQTKKESQPLLEVIKRKIIGREYQSAFEEFQEKTFKKRVIKKQKMVIKKVLIDYGIKFMKSDWTSWIQRQVNKFIATLDEEEIWQNYKEKSDFLYYVESYLPKVDNPYSYWDAMFSLKKSKELLGLEQLNALDNMTKEQNEEQMYYLKRNIDKEYEESGRETALAIYQEERLLKLFFLRVRLFLRQYDLKKAAFYINRQMKKLSENNMNVLETYGLKNYDISKHDPFEFKQRIKNFYLQRGVNRHFNCIKKLYKPLFEQISEIQDQEREEFIVSYKQAKIQFDEEVLDKRKPKRRKPSKEQRKIIKNEVKERQEIKKKFEKIVSTIQVRKQILVDTYTPQLAQQLFREEQNFILDTEILSMLMIKNRDQFQKASTFIRLESASQVQDLISWGIENKEPMAIYMGQKLAMLTKQIIPHYLAKHVSDLFSHRRDHPKEWIDECKKCLQVVGKIERQHIYDFNYDYHHIIDRKDFNEMIFDTHSKTQERIEMLGFFNPKQKQMNDQLAKKEDVIKLYSQ